VLSKYKSFLFNIIQSKTEESKDNLDDNGEQISSLPKPLKSAHQNRWAREKENSGLKDITNSLHEMKACMATIITRITRSEIINKNSRDELTELLCYSMKTNVIRRMCHTENNVMISVHNFYSRYFLQTLINYISDIIRKGRNSLPRLCNQSLISVWY